MSPKRVFLFLPILTVLLAACAAAATPESTATPAPTATPTEISPTATPEPTPIDPLSIGDPEAGREMFETGGGILGIPCGDCHSLDETAFTGRYAGPALQGISETAAQRIEGLSSVEYLYESIRDPGAYIVDGYGSHMETIYTLMLSDEQIDNLVAFLLTQ